MNKSLNLTLSLTLALTLAACADSPRVHRSMPGAVGAYSGSVEADDVVYVSGQIGSERGNIKAEVASAIDHLGQQLDAAGLRLKDLVSVTVYLTDINDFTAMNEVYADRIKPPYPARATVAVAALPTGAKVEIQAIAVRR